LRLVPQVFNAEAFQFRLKPLPTIARIDERLQEHPPFMAAHPMAQPDAPKEAERV